LEEFGDMAFALQGLIKANASADDEGYRTYDTEWRVKSTLTGDHGAQALVTAGLPLVGATYILDNDFDTDAYCLPGWKATRETDDPGKPNWYIVRIPFSTKPMWRCQDARPLDPLLEPLRKGGSSKTIMGEAVHDAMGNLFANSASQPITGKLAEIEKTGGSQVWVEANVASIDLDLLSSLEHHVNDALMWNLSARKIEFDSWTFENKFYGVCFEFFTLRMLFNIDGNTFDRVIPDKGTMVWDGAGDPAKATSYIRAKDDSDENIECYLDLSGNRWDKITPANIEKTWRLKPEGDLSLLGVASAFA
jgi:hypothetical protein